MDKLSPRFSESFFEVYENLPRQGSGKQICAAGTLGFCRELRESPAVLYLGSGVGGQTFHLAEELLSGTIRAIDSHLPSIERLLEAITARCLWHRVSAMVGDMAHPEQPLENFDLIGSEGRLYRSGLRNTFRVCQELLHPGGDIAFTAAIWRKENPPPAVQASFDLDYPTMGSLDDDQTTIQDYGFDLIGHFTSPDEAWRDDFYPPETRSAKLRAKYANDVAVSAILNRPHGYAHTHPQRKTGAGGNTI